MQAYLMDLVFVRQQMLVCQLRRNFAHSAIFFCANPSMKKYIFSFPICCWRKQDTCFMGKG